MLETQRILTGRSFIYTDKTEIDRSNVAEVLRDAISYHDLNKVNIDYLFKYWKGEQPILSRVKEIRPNINNKVVVNRADEIVSFKVGYVFGEPLQYVSRKGEYGDEIERLNDIMTDIDKEALDKELAEWFSVGGIGYRMVLPAKNPDDEVPIRVFTLDPRYTFVVHSNALGNPPVMGVTYVKRADDTKLYSVYTKNTYFEIIGDKIIKEEPHTLGYIPIIEYYTSKAQLGEFEKVVSLLDALNLMYSDRVNGVEQFVQSLMKFVNADISEDDFEKLKDLGAIKVKSTSANPADVEFMSQELNQSGVQLVIDDFYQAVLTICGMPNRNGGSSTSDTGIAVVYRDGWQLAESRAKDVEVMYKRSEKQFLRIVLRILKDYEGINLPLSAIDIKFTRRYYQNNSEKANILTTLLDCDKIHPRLAFEQSGMFSDVESAYQMSMEHYESTKAANATANEGNNVTDGTETGTEAQTVGVGE